MGYRKKHVSNKRCLEAEYLSMVVLLLNGSQECPDSRLRRELQSFTSWHHHAKSLDGARERERLRDTKDERKKQSRIDRLPWGGSVEEERGCGALLLSDRGPASSGWRS